MTFQVTERFITNISSGLKAKERDHPQGEALCGCAQILQRASISTASSPCQMYTTP